MFHSTRVGITSNAFIGGYGWFNQGCALLLEVVNGICCLFKCIQYYTCMEVIVQGSNTFARLETISVFTGLH